MGSSLALGNHFTHVHLLDLFHNVGHHSHTGMHTKAIFVPDVNASVEFRLLDTMSDVLAIYQEPVRLFSQLPF